MADVMHAHRVIGVMGKVHVSLVQQALVARNVHHRPELALVVLRATDCKQEVFASNVLMDTGAIACLLAGFAPAVLDAFPATRLGNVINVSLDMGSTTLNVRNAVKECTVQVSLLALLVRKAALKNVILGMALVCPVLSDLVTLRAL